MKAFVMYTDGGARGNPGPAGVGVILQQVQSSKFKVQSDGVSSRQDLVIKRIKKYIGETTNNVAEYSAVILGLEEALRLGAEEVELRLDSELVGKQLCGEYKVKDKNMQSLFLKAWNLKTRLKRFIVTIIPREENRKADELVNEVLDEESRNT